MADVEKKIDLPAGDADEAKKKPLGPHDSLRPISDFETMVHWLKANIGTGIFAIPDAFKNAGLWMGTIALPIMAIISTHCMQLLLTAAAVIKERDSDCPMSYADVTESIFLNGPKRLVKFSSFAKFMINLFICITQFGFCCVYLVFISSNLQQVVEFYAHLEWDVRIYMMILTVPLIFLNWIRNLKYLAVVSLIANIIQSTCICIVFYYILQDLPAVSSRPAVGSLGRLPLFFGTAIYTFEGISLVLPIQKDMIKPKHFPGLLGLANTGMVIVTCIYVGMGFFGYLKYGEDVQGSITLDLPSDEILAQSVKLFMVLAIFGSYALQFYVPIPILWPSISRHFDQRYDLLGEYIFRTVVIILITALAAAIPRLDLFISLVGAVGSSFICLIFPPILEMVIFWPTVSRWVILKNVLIILFGFLGFATGTYASIEAIVVAFSSEGS